MGFRQKQKRHLRVMRGWVVVGRFWVNATEVNTVAKCTKRELPHRGEPAEGVVRFGMIDI